MYIQKKYFYVGLLLIAGCRSSQFRYQGFYTYDVTGIGKETFHDKKENTFSNLKSLFLLKTLLFLFRGKYISSKQKMFHVRNFFSSKNITIIEDFPLQMKYFCFIYISSTIVLILCVNLVTIVLIFLRYPLSKIKNNFLSTNPILHSVQLF